MVENHNIDKIVENVWLGNYISSLNIKALKDKCITKILVITDRKIPEYNKEDGFNHLVFKVADFSSQNIIQYFGECLNFIKGEEKVLVHSISGSSRSASIIIAYIIGLNKMTFEEAFQFVKEKRNCIGPKKGVVELLKIEIIKRK